MTARAWGRRRWHRPPMVRVVAITQADGMWWLTGGWVPASRAQHAAQRRTDTAHRRVRRRAARR